LRLRTAVLAIALISVILVSLFVAIEWLNNDHHSSPEFFVGVELAYGSLSDYKDLVDKVKDYTNLFVVGAPEISFNQTLLNATCDYIYGAGLSFIVLFTSTDNYTTYIPYVWIIKARQKYGDKFLGVYRIDEPGGKQLDNNKGRFVVEAKNYTDAADIYVELLYAHLEYYLYSAPMVLTAEYGLYWFDYKGGYDTTLAEFGWNFSRPLHVALCRGAARAQNKDWGVIVTWTYYDTPYIESGNELYKDLVLAYNAGAKYAVVFDFPNITRYGILAEEHFDALQRFWTYIHGSPESHGSVEGEVAYVLPKDYGYGFRGPYDNIWGLWGPDQLSKKVWDDVNNLVGRYGSHLDIVCDDPGFSNALENRYDKLFFWNETVT
jgi:hypothetical protein